MPNVIRVSFIFLFSFMLMACAAPYRLDYDRQVNFELYQSFAVKNVEPSATLSLAEQRLRTFLTESLKKKGHRVVSENEADLLVQYGYQERIRREGHGPNFHGGIGFRRARFGMTAPSVEYEYQERYLMLEMVDPETNRVVWQAVSNRSVNDFYSSEDMQAYLQASIDTMLDAFPPKDPESRQ